jgi:hypothetical protein
MNSVVSQPVEYSQRGLAGRVPKDHQVAKLKADLFYPAIAQAITQLPSNERRTRQKIYERARRVLTSKLHGQAPSLIAHERHALEMAISRVEALAKVQERAADTTAPSSPPKPKISLLPKVLLGILLGTLVAAAVAQLPIPWRRLLIWCCGI